MNEQLALLPGYLTAHLQLALAALLVGASISIPLGIAVSRQRRVEPGVMAVASVMQTIPSLALLALMVPLLAALHLPSIGYLPAFIALVLYSMLPILRNTVSGLRGVDEAMIDAARAVGMTGREQLFRVELPLALPIIAAGVRTAMAWTVGMATLSTPVGAPSLGNYVFGGLQTRNYAAVIVGCVAAAGLALLLDALAHLFVVGVERRKRGALAASFVGFALLYLYAGTSFAVETFSRAEAPVVIGAKTFTEQLILSELMSDQIRRSAGRAASVKQSLGSTVAFDALRSGDIDAYVDYSGTIWATIMHRTDRPTTREAMIAEIGSFLERQHGIRVVGPLGFENAYALAMRRERAKALGAVRIGDLAAHASELSIGGDYEFFGRPEYKAIVAAYGVHFRAERSMDPALMYQAIAQDSVDVISAFSSDGRIAAFDLVLLADDRGAIPPYDAIVLAGKRLTEREPRVIAALASLVGLIDGDAMRRMNAQVDDKHDSPKVVATGFLNRLREAAH